MVSLIDVYIGRAENELRLAKALLLLSGKEDVKIQLEAERGDTFYSAVISNAYYAIFYVAKALLLTKGITTKAPEVHKKTIDDFKKEFVVTGILDYKLLEIYREMIISADELLGLFEREKWKRGNFTYKVASEANLPFAEESVKNAKIFVQNILAVLENR